jgi:hypothetical protein
MLGTEDRLLWFREEIGDEKGETTVANNSF